MKKRLSSGDRLQRNFRRVLTSKSGNYIFPEEIVQAVFSNRNNMTATQKLKNTNLLKKYAKNRYQKLYRETEVQYGGVRYSYKEWKEREKEDKWLKNIAEEDYGKWKADNQGKTVDDDFVVRNPYDDRVFNPLTGEIYEDRLQNSGDIAFDNFVDDFLSKLQEPPMYTQYYRGRQVKRWDKIVNFSEARKASLRSITMDEVAKVGKTVVGNRLRKYASEKDVYLNAVLYGSSIEIIENGYEHLVYIITEGDVSEKDLEDIAEQEEYNSTYN